MSATWDLLANLPLTVTGYELEGRRKVWGPEFTRVTTTIHLDGAGETGLGEDVTYQQPDQEAHLEAGPLHPLAGDWTLATFCEHVGTLDLFPTPPEAEASQHYRRWAYESAALDLALRQAGRPLHDVVQRDPVPLTFVNSLRLAEPPSIEPIDARLDAYPTLKLKVDARSSWTEELFDQLAATGAVDSVDLKGFYR